MKNTRKTALVYCDSQFGLADGKTAAGLVRHSEIYNIVGVIDSQLAGQDAGEALGEHRRDIPIFSDLSSALAGIANVPDCYIYGKAPLSAFLCPEERLLITEAMNSGMDIINGLHQFFSDDQEFAETALRNKVQIRDIRKPPRMDKLSPYTGRISEVDVPVVAVLGTDCACGKMTTAIELNNTLNSIGIKSVLIATGQTALMQGAKYGVSIDALVSQFVIGELENSILKAFENDAPDIILVEGQGAVSHPAFMSSIAILKGARPDSVILQHAPARRFRCDFPHLPMPDLEKEIALIEAISPTKVIAITLSHEGMSEHQVQRTVSDFETRLQLPTMDVLSHGCQDLVNALSDSHPTLTRTVQRRYRVSSFINSLAQPGLVHESG